MRLEETFATVAYASGRLDVGPVVQYFRARLQDGQVQDGPSAATFRRVHVRGQPGADLFIHIETAAQGVRVEIRDTTVPPAPDLPDETARWRNVGLTPKGALVNPAHLD
jgi:hypothetical protein